MKNQLTEKEFAVAAHFAITSHESCGCFDDSENLSYNNPTDIKEAIPELSEHQIAGIMSSLEKKRLICDSGDSPRGDKNTDWYAEPSAYLSYPQLKHLVTNHLTQEEIKMAKAATKKATSTKTASKAKAATKKAATAKKTVAKEVKQLKQQEECQSMIGSSRKETNARLKELRDMQKKLRKEAKELREEAKKEKEATKTARKELANGRKGYREANGSLRKSIVEFRNTIKSAESVQEVEDAFTSLEEFCNQLQANAMAMRDSKIEILKVSLVEEDWDE